MSTEAPEQGFVAWTEKFRDWLLESGRLTREDISRVQDTMRNLGIGFIESVLLHNLVTPAEISEARRSIGGEPAENEHPIGRALLPLSRGRPFPVKYAGRVKAGPKLMLTNSPDSEHSERIRALRTELMLLNSSASPSGDHALGGIYLAVLSPGRSEGRTQLCAELAVGFSQLGRRTLLVDADLRRPRMHTLFEAENSFGLAQSLNLGHNPRVLEVDLLPSLFFVPAGPVQSTPLELLSNGNLERQMLDWRDEYDVIILDTPPVTEFSDGLVIAACIDQVLVATRVNSTSHKEMRDMLRRLASTQTRLVGAIMNEF